MTITYKGHHFSELEFKFIFPRDATNNRLKNLLICQLFPQLSR